MIQSEHISREELLALLESNLGTEKTSRCEDHLQQCESCRWELDRLAAHSEVWQKTPRLLRQNAGSSNFVDLGSGELETRDLVPSESHCVEGDFGYGTESLLGPPKHPEMIGRIGRYDVEREIGRGGMGVVFKAHDAELNRPLAIKVLAPHLANHGPARKRFAQEARAAAGVLHPNVIAVHDVDNEGNTPFIVMPYIAGASLQTVVEQNGPIDELEIVRMALQIAAGLTPAHAQGLVHRDIKPANILVERGANRVIITDFGLARAENDASMTRTGWLTGTPNYMSPEQTRGQRLDHRSDLFSLGSLLYFLATGRLPFRAESPLGVLNRIQNDEPTPVREVNPRISKTLSNIIHALLKKDVLHRYQTAGDLHEVLEQHLAHLHQPEIANPPKVIGVNDGSWKSYFVFAAACILILAVGLSFSKGLLTNQSESPVLAHSDNDEDGSVSAPADTNREFIAVPKPGYMNPPTPFEEEIYRVVTSAPIDKSGRKQFNAGMHALGDNDYDAAIKHFKNAAQHDAFAKTATYNIACALALKGEQDQAFKYLEKAIRIGFIDIDQYQDDSDLDSLRDDDRFQPLLDRVEQMNEAELLVKEAKSYVNKQQMDEAIDLCRQALKLNPDNAQAMVNLGYALHVRGDFEEAMVWHRRAANSESESALGNYNVACVHALRGEKAKALEHLHRALDAGLADVLGTKFIQNDSDLDILAGDDQFESFLNDFNKARNPVFGSYFQVRRGNDDFTQMMSADWKNLQEVKGEWECRLMGDRVRISLTQSSEGKDLKWGFSSEFNVSDFDPALETGIKQFELAAKQGKLVFDGVIKQRKGSGSFEFEASQSYIKELADEGIDNVPDALLFRMLLFSGDEEAFIKNLKDLQGLDLDEDTLGPLMVHNVEAGVVEEYIDRDLDPEDYLLYIVWRVPAKLIVRYQKAGFENLDEYKKYINQRVEPELIKSYINSGLNIADHDKFITWRVDPTLLKRYKKIGLPLKENESFINQRVEPGLLKDYLKAGFKLDDYSDLISSRVTASELKGYIDAGLQPDAYRRYLRQRVPAKLISQYRDAGLDLKKLDYFLQSRVEAKDIVDYQDYGLFNEKYKRFLIHRVPANLLENYKKNELDPLKLKKFVRQRVPAELLIRYQDSGLDFEKHKDAIFRRVDPQKVLDKQDAKEN